MRNRKYWKDRLAREIVMGERSAIEYQAELEQVYQITVKEIQKDIDSFYAKYAIANKVPYAEARRWLNAKEFKEFQAYVKQWYAESKTFSFSTAYSAYLEALAKRTNISRLESLQAAARYQIERLHSQEYVRMTDLLSINYMAAYYGNYFVLAQGAEMPVLFDTLDVFSIEKAVKIRWSKANYSDRIWADRDKLIRNMEILIPQSFSMGRSSQWLGDELAKKMNTSKNHGRTLTRTEVNHICNQASLDMYKLAGIEEYEFLATLDERTTDICRSLDGQVFKVTQAQVNINYPPMHPNCRSTTVPRFTDEDVLERVARNENGKTIRVPRRMTQEEYINTYIPESDRARLLRFRNRYYPNSADAVKSYQL